MTQVGGLRAAGAWWVFSVLSMFTHGQKLRHSLPMVPAVKDRAPPVPAQRGPHTSLSAHSHIWAQFTPASVYTAQTHAPVVCDSP